MGEPSRRFSIRRKQIQQNGDDGLLAEVHQVLAFKRQKPPRAKHVVIGIEQMAHGPGQRVVFQGLPYPGILHAGEKLGESARR